MANDDTPLGSGAALRTGAHRTGGRACCPFKTIRGPLEVRVRADFPGEIRKVHGIGTRVHVLVHKLIIMILLSKSWIKLLEFIAVEQGS